MIVNNLQNTLLGNLKKLDYERSIVTVFLHKHLRKYIKKVTATSHALFSTDSAAPYIVLMSISVF